MAVMNMAQIPLAAILKILSHTFLLDAVKWYFKENKKLFQSLLDEKRVFKSLFFQNIYDPSKDERRIKKMERESAIKKAKEAAEEEREERKRLAMETAEGALGEDLDLDQLQDEEEDSEEEEDLMYYGPPPIPLKLYIDKITDWFHPFDVYFIYFTRLDRGPIRLPDSLDVADANMSKVRINMCKQNAHKHLLNTEGGVSKLNLITMRTKFP